MILSCAENAWSDYLYWQQTDKKIIKPIKVLIKDVKQNPFDGIGDPDPPKHNWTGYWSRRINREDRLVYKVSENSLIIAQGQYHS